MVLGGLWHGAAWPFVLWGAYQGVLLIAYREAASAGAACGRAARSPIVAVARSARGC